MKRVGVYEAKSKLPMLLDRVARGARITITRHGVPVAVLVPPDGAARRPAREVVALLQAFGKGRRLRGLSLRAAIDKGRH